MQIKALKYNRSTKSLERGDDIDRKDSSSQTIHIPILREVPQNLYGAQEEQELHMNCRMTKGTARPKKVLV